MGVVLTKFEGGASPFTFDGTYTNAVTWVVTPAGGVLTAKYWLSMEDPNAEYCTGGNLYATDAEGNDESSWFTFAPDENGEPGEFASSLEFELDLGEEIPVWIRVTVPEGVEEDARTDISISMSYIRLEANP